MRREPASPHVAWLLLLLAAVAAASALAGRYPAPGFTSPFAFAEDPLALRLLLGVRLPRIAAGILLGASLAAAGTVFQMVFANPLVEPGFLGVSQGAAFGAALGIVAFHAGPAGVQALALACGVAGLAGSYLVARTFRYGGWVLRLVLAGIAVSALLSAGVGALKLAADPLGELPELTFWLLGGLWRASWREVLAVLPAIAAGLGAVLLLRGRLDVLSLDDRVAHSLGAAASRERLLLLLAATLATAAAVSVSGLVGWIGLMAPHAARRLFGASSRRSLPAAVLLGAAAVLACDTLARTLLPAEIPLGIVTAVVGAGGFLGLMATGGREHGG
jgi:iron complex transport system permease protein